MSASEFPVPTSAGVDDFLSAATAVRGTSSAAEAGRPLRICLGAIARGADMLAIITAICCVLSLHRLLGAGNQVGYATSAMLPSAAFGLLFVILLDRRGGYRPYVSLLAVRETERILRVTVESFLLALLIAYFTRTQLSRLDVLAALVTVPVFVALVKCAVHSVLRWLRAKGHGTRRAVIAGAGPLGKRIYSAMLRSPEFGLNPVAFVDEDPQMSNVEIYESSYQRKCAARVLNGPICPELLRELDASVLVIATPGGERDRVSRICQARVDTYCVREDSSHPGLWIDYADFDGIMLEHFSRGRPRIVGDFAKRVIDVAASVVLLALFAPLFALIAILVKATSPGPALFLQERVGKNGRQFSMYKFRTMYRDAPHYSYSPGAGDDPRVTRVGRFLRRTSMDELPQLVNVFVGDMSLVGPRPEMPFIVEQYTPSQRRRLSVKPGITGLWQLSADRAFLIHENLEYDLYYVRYRSLFMDIAILLHTLLFAGRGI